eukprot:CAMPEP_0115077904 /NCGR_PEP_ID=MMETSP0227-20121206/17259_1 /TAXON_ID=89957 /ORGANISM="Polarella glacialis, Strain CCMP 1383" /LENGTH=86 /DNA_ID=CAMNT_0002465243 /DNA_START=47 /DNA_END=303 /DNA_ORIENTATION=-
MATSGRSVLAYGAAACTVVHVASNAFAAPGAAPVTRNQEVVSASSLRGSSTASDSASSGMLPLGGLALAAAVGASTSRAVRRAGQT